MQPERDLDELGGSGSFGRPRGRPRYRPTSPTPSPAPRPRSPRAGTPSPPMTCPACGRTPPGALPPRRSGPCRRGSARYPGRWCAPDSRAPPCTRPPPSDGGRPDTGIRVHAENPLEGRLAAVQATQGDSDAERLVGDLSSRTSHSTFTNKTRWSVDISPETRASRVRRIPLHENDRETACPCGAPSSPFAPPSPWSRSSSPPSAHSSVEPAWACERCWKTHNGKTACIRVEGYESKWSKHRQHGRHLLVEFGDRRHHSRTADLQVLL